MKRAGEAERHGLPVRSALADGRLEVAVLRRRPLRAGSKTRSSSGIAALISSKRSLTAAPVTRRAICSAPRNPRCLYTGGVLDELEEERGAVRRGAPNLTSSPHGLKAWSEDDLAGYLKRGVGSRARLMGTMNEVVLNSTRHLTEEDTRAMAVYLKSLAPAGDTGSRPSQKVTGARRQAVRHPLRHLPSADRQGFGGYRAAACGQRLRAGAGSVVADRPGHQWPATADAGALHRSGSDRGSP